MCKCTPEIRTPYCGKGECVWPGSKPEGARSSTPQDVEEFIAKHAYQDGHDRFSCRCVSVEALTDWMTGHVRVPVELLTKDGINQALIVPPEVKGRVMAEMFWRGVYAAQEAMLNASKGDL